jgi:hypothetical protein
VWQRGTSIAGSAGSYLYTADRWQTNASTALTVSRQATGDTTNLPFIQYCARVQRNNASTATAAAVLSQSFETINSIPYAGKTVTLSFYARRGANFSGASNQLEVYLPSGTGTDQNAFVGGFTGATNVIYQTPTLTTTWQRFSYTGTVATTATQLATQFTYTPTGTAGAADFYEVTGVQIDIGSVALPFRTYAGTLQGELAACLRYFWRYVNGTGARVAVAQNYSTSDSLGVLTFPTIFRTSPAVTVSSAGHFSAQDSAAGPRVLSAFSADSFTPSSCRITSTTSVAALVAGNATLINSSNASATLDFGAEL